MAAVRAVLAAGAEHIKLRPTSGYKFDQQGVPQYMAMYKPEVLKAMIDEAHRNGKRTGCHSFGGEGLKDSVVHGCDSIEHGYNLTQELCTHDGPERAVRRSDSGPVHGAVHGR